jgi:hypothetical protein
VTSVTLHRNRLRCKILIASQRTCVVSQIAMRYGLFQALASYDLKPRFFKCIQYTFLLKYAPFRSYKPFLLLIMAKCRFWTLGARRHLPPETTLSNNRATMLFYSCLADILPIFNRFDIRSNFLLLINGRMSISIPGDAPNQK